jgi:CheY-like chemotaxis protein
MSKISVLVVDDAPFIRDLVKKCLRNAFPGIAVEDAVNGRKAQTLMMHNTYDMVPVSRKTARLCLSSW